MALRAGGFAPLVARVVGASIAANEVKKIELLPRREESPLETPFGFTGAGSQPVWWTPSESPGKVI
jgi:hypothetical protein